MNLIQRLRNWTMRLPNIGGLGQAEIHSSLLITLSLLSGLIFLLSVTRPGFAEFRTAAVSLPVIWIISLAVRVAAQMLAIGEHSHDLETVVGPSGNLATDYEYLPARHVFAYGASGQVATLGLALLGLIVNAAMIPAASAELATAQLLDLKGGWSSQAWASQIMWVNMFLAALHLLPTVPFDMRAIMFAFFSRKNRNPSEPEVFRRIAKFDSHMAGVMFGSGVTAAALGVVFRQEIVGWYAAVAAAVYLFVASQWESARAEEVEEQYAPLSSKTARHDSGHSTAAYLKMNLDRRVEEAADEFVGRASATTDEVLAGYAEPSFMADVDVDDILRKLHREGAESLSTWEQEALLSASRELKERRAGPR